MDINPKMIKRDSKEKNRSNKNNNNNKQTIQNTERKKKSNTFFFHTVKPVKRESAKKLSIYPSLTNTNKSSFKSKNASHIKRMDSRELKVHQRNFNLMLGEIVLEYYFMINPKVKK